MTRARFETLSLYPMLALSLLGTAVLLSAAEPPVAVPEPTVTLPVTIDGVIDGDTLDTEVLGVVVRVRLIECWAPEQSDLAGPGATTYLEKLCPVGAAATLSVHLPKKRRGGKRHFADVFTFGRVLGRISVDGTDVGRAMVESGNATKTKRPAPPVERDSELQEQP